MRKVYSAENIFTLNQFTFALDAAGIAYLVKNEHVQSSVGETPFNEAWPELWVVNNEDEDKAKLICQTLEKQSQSNEPQWFCRHCGEQNASSFEFCWRCQNLAPEN